VLSGLYAVGSQARFALSVRLHHLFMRDRRPAVHLELPGLYTRIAAAGSIALGLGLYSRAMIVLENAPATTIFSLMVLSGFLASVPAPRRMRAVPFYRPTAWPPSRQWLIRGWRP